MQSKSTTIRFSLLGLVLGAMAACAVVLFGLGVGVEPQIVQAQVNTDLADFQEASQLGDQDIRVTIGKVVRVVLAFLGIIAVVIVLYAGFLWMTAGGNEDQVATAKRIMIQGVIGLLIIMSALAITQFVLKEFGEATGTEFTTGGSGSGSGGGPLGSGGSKTFTVTSIVPTGSVPNYNVSVHILFSQVPQIASVNENVTLRKSGQTDPVPVDIKIDKKHVTLTAQQECGGEGVPGGKKGCLEKNTKYIVEIGSGKTGVKAEDGKQLKCGLGSSCTGTFTTGDQLDMTEPFIDITTPDDGAQVPQDTSVPIEAIVGDNLGISLVEFVVDGDIVEKVPVGPDTKLPKIVGTSAWDTSGFSLGSSHTITAKAYDFDGNTKTSAAVKVKVAPAHCFDGEQTPGTDETGIDCSPSGGACGLCNGGQCSTDADCASGVCVGNTDFPKNVLAGTSNFTDWEVSGSAVQEDGGETLWSMGDGDVASLAQTLLVSDIIGNTYTASVTIENVRGDHKKMYLMMMNASGTSEVVEMEPVEFVDGDGKKINAEVTHKFTGNEISDLRVALLCEGCGEGGILRLSNMKVTWDATDDPQEGAQCVNVPLIEHVSPEKGGQGRWVTITGKYFGDSGTVSLLDKSGDVVEKLAVSQAQCGGAATWTDTAIVVEIPESLSAETVYPIEVSNSLGEDVTDNDRGAYLPDAFTALDQKDGDLPGLCAVVPSAEKPGNSVGFFGKNLGTDTEAQTLRFGGQTGIITESSSNTSLTAVVPQISVGTFLTTVEVKDEKTNPLLFTVLGDADTPAPAITKLSAEKGPEGQYLTITGTNFGDFQNIVKFTKLDDKLVPTQETVLGSFDFPAQCSLLGTWDDTSITVKVPETSLGNYHISVIRNDSDNDPDNDVSNSVVFAVTDETPTPGLCALIPNNGPEGTPVVLHGEGFGDNQSQVVFYDKVGDEPSSKDWQDTRIDAEVPDEAQTGPVYVTERFSQLQSNQLNFAVQNCTEDESVCGPNAQCCSSGSCIPLTDEAGNPLSCDTFGVPEASYTYSFFTGDAVPNGNDFPPRVIEECSATTLPSPTPWESHAGGTSVCTDSALLGVRFSIPLVEKNLTVNEGTKGAFQLYECVGENASTCAEVADSQVALSLLSYMDLAGGDLDGDVTAQQSYVSLLPKTSFKPGTWYLMALTDKITGLHNGMSLVGNTSCSGTAAEGNGVYCYQFKTADTGSSCTLGSAQVAPTKFTVTDTNQLEAGSGLILNPNKQTVVTEEGEEIETENPLQWQVFGKADESECLLVNTCSPAFDWTWESNDPEVVIPESVAGAGQCIQTMQVVGESKQVIGIAGGVQKTPTFVTAQEASGVSDDTEIYVDYGSPKVLEQCGGQVQSPSPWSKRTGGQNACINSVVNAVFTHEMNPTTFTNDAIYVQECVGTGEGSAACESLGDKLLTVATVFTADTETKVRDGVQVRVVKQTDGDVPVHINWKPNTWYRVAMTTALTSVDGVAMEPNTGCAAGESYCFTFKSDDTTEECIVDSVEVAPGFYTAENFGLVLDHDKDPVVPTVFTAKPLAEDQCIVLEGNTMQWDWAAENNKSTEGAVNLYDGAGPVDALNDAGLTQSIWAKTETLENFPSQVNATTQDKTGTSQVTVDLVPPTIGLAGPTCATACVNTSVFVEFDQKIDLNALVADFTVGNHDKIAIVPCSNESCLVGVDAQGFLDKQVENSGLNIKLDPDAGAASSLTILHPGLQQNTWYRALIRIGDGGLVNEAGVSIPVSAFEEDELYPAENPQYYSWTFRTKKDGSLCGIESAKLEPQEAVVPGAGIVVSYAAEAYGAPDSCNPSTGQKLQSSSYDWTWNIANTALATFVGGTPVDTADVSESPMCTASCVGKASQPYGTAVCGNKVVEAGEACDDGGLANGDGCSAICLWEGSAPLAEEGACGDGTVQYGEACDGTPGCGSNCTLLGSASTFAQCGNGDVGEGEECDGGPGCTSSCLLAGTGPAYDACEDAKEKNSGFSCVGVRVCGNGVIEPGEDPFCDAAVAAEKGGPVAACTPGCQLVGGTPKSSASDQVYCGNGIIDSSDGEQCDDGNQVNGDGCSTSCLLEGSSAGYNSFCGDGVVATGELASCEQAAGGFSLSGDGNVDHRQYVVGLEGSNAPVVDNKQSTEVTATAAGVTAVGNFALQCGFTHDTQCPAGMAVGTDSCCHLRPTIEYNSIVPVPGSKNLCRNIAIAVEFDQVINENTISKDTVLVVQSLPSAEECTASGGTVVEHHEKNPNDPWYRRAWFAVANGVRGIFGATPLYASVSCSGAVDVNLQLVTIQKEINGAMVNVSKVMISPTELFDADEYKIVFADTIANQYGATLGKSVVWDYTVGEDICTIDRVSITPVEHIFFGVGDEANQLFVASAETKIGGQYHPIVGSINYEWKWDWKVIKEGIAQLGDTKSNEAYVIPTANKGATALRARAIVTTNTLFEGEDSDAIISGYASLFNAACENPWPHAGVPNIDQYSTGPLSFPFEDVVTSPQTNVSTWYCRGNTGEQLLPSFTVQNATIPAQDPNDPTGLLKSIFFRNPVNGDAIGLRIHKNANYLSPRDWYASQGFVGNPNEIEIAGYQALQEGTTVYVGAANVIGDDFGYNGPRFANMYVLSFNEDAAEVTKQVYDQLVENIMFNANIDHKWNQGICVGGSMFNFSQTANPDSPLLEALGAPLDVSCQSVMECAQDPQLVKESTIFGKQLFGCATINEQLQRDLIRLGDLQSMRGTVDAYAIQTGNPPTINSGTFLGGLAVSTWDSWKTTFGEALGVSVPVDPVNQHYSTYNAWTSLQASGEDVAPGFLLGSGCEAEGADPNTCWNAALSTYECKIGSHVYQYQAQLGNTEQPYRLHASLEVGSADQWSGTPLTDGSLPFGFSSMCSSQELAPGDVCGDGVLSPSEDCEIGTLIGGEGSIEDPKSCTVIDADGNEYPGHYVYQCPNSCQFASDPLAAGATCEPLGQCGDGVVNGSEVCDDGLLNGSYNNCSSDCSQKLSSSGSCGDGFVQGNFGEVCDLGESATFCWPTQGGTCLTVTGETLQQLSEAFVYSKSGGGVQGLVPCVEDPTSSTGGRCAGMQKVCDLSSGSNSCAWGELSAITPAGQTIYNPDKEQSCNWDCQDYGPYCGDGVVNGSGVFAEECDTEPVVLDQSCTTINGQEGVPTQTCTASCTLNPITCVAKTSGGSAPIIPAFCGDGKIQPENGEECDAGTSNGAVCTALYGSSCNYCSNTCKTITLSGGVCGDGVRQANEECDTDDHGSSQCTSFGFTGGDLVCGNDCTFDKSLCTQ